MTTLIHILQGILMASIILTLAIACAWVMEEIGELTSYFIDEWDNIQKKK